MQAARTLPSKPSREELIARRDRARVELARRSLADFVRQAWPIVEPAMPLMWGWHVDAICEHLEAVTRGEILRLAINVPPGHAKSILVSVMWPAWLWIQRPAWRSIFASYAQDLANRDSGRCRALIDSDWYASNFREPAGWELKHDANRIDHFENDATGARRSLSVGSKGTGFRGDLVVVDDPLNARDAHSKAARDDAIRWWDKAMSSRFNDPRKARRVIIMQRLHEEDLTGHVEATGGYEILRLPSEFDPKRRTITCGTRRVERAIADAPPPEVEALRPVELPAGEVRASNAPPVPKVGVVSRTPHPTKPGVEIVRERFELFRDPRSAQGDLLFPSLFDPDVIAQAKRDLGSDGYAAQHDQTPTPSEGGMFKKRFWRFYKPDGVAPEGTIPRPDGCNAIPAVALPDRFDRVLLSLDAAFKGAAQNDRVAFVIVGVRKADRFVLDRSCRTRTFTETIAEFERLCAKWPFARRKLVEEKANGSAIIDTLHSKIPGIIGIEPEGGKEARAHAILPEIEAGNVYLPEGASWLDEWIDEFAAFPLGKHDDQVDALSQALIDLAASPGVARARSMASL